jgi:site-specific recombinase XerD
MRAIPVEVIKRYETLLETRDIASHLHGHYKKWLRYFLDYCEKYPSTGGNSEHTRLFLEKLRQKKQSAVQCQQAAHAIALFFEMQRMQTEKHILERATDTVSQQQPIHTVRNIIAPFRFRPPKYSETGYQEKSDSLEWDNVIGKLADEIKVRHYSRKTLRTYAHWSRHFQQFLKSKPPAELTTADVKEYLTWLAVTCHVAASTQNQAFRKSG